MRKNRSIAKKGVKTADAVSLLLKYRWILFNVQFDWLIEMLRNIFTVLFTLSDAFGEKIFNLSVNGTEIVLCPGCQLIIQRFRHAERDLLLRFFCHDLIQTSAVYDRLSVFVSAKNNQQIGNHSGLSFFVQSYNFIFIELFKSHFHHADSSVYNHFTCVDDC